LHIGGSRLSVVLKVLMKRKKSDHVALYLVFQNFITGDSLDRTAQLRAVFYNTGL